MYRMSKRWICYLLLLLISFSLYGCVGNSKQQLHADKVQNKLITMESYACIAQVTHINDEKKNTYQAKQIYQTNGKYRMEIIEPKRIAGIITTFDGEKILQYNPYIRQSKIAQLCPNSFRNQMFLGTFVHNYLQSENVALEAQNIEGSDTAVLEAVIPGGSSYMASQKLWINQSTYKPVRMAIYNKENKETVIIEFLEFVYNPKVENSVFTIQ